MVRFFHSWDKWECYRSGFYKSDNCYSKDRQIELSRDIFLDLKLFDLLVKKVLSDWVHSSEHFLTSPGQNVIAWLGQAACAYAYRISNDISRHGYNAIDEKSKAAADSVALRNYEEWIKRVNSEERQLGLWV